jgi:hypothetical protein
MSLRSIAAALDHVLRLSAARQIIDDAFFSQDMAASCGNLLAIAGIIFVGIDSGICWSD